MAQLTYANAELGKTLIRPHSASTAPPNGTVIYLPRTTTQTPGQQTTTKKSGFFNNLRNIFSRGSSTTTTMPPTIATTTRKTSTSTNVWYHIQSPNQHTLRNGAQASLHNSNGQLHDQNKNYLLSVPQIPPSVLISSTHKPTMATTEAAKKPQMEEFPPLTPQRRNRPLPTQSSITNVQLPSSTARASTSTTRRSTSITTSQPRFIPNSHPLSRTQSSSSIISIDSRNENSKGSTQRPELATDTEIEELTELLLKKSTTLYSHITVNLQGKTKSSALTDEASQP